MNRRSFVTAVAALLSGGCAIKQQPTLADKMTTTTYERGLERLLARQKANEFNVLVTQDGGLNLDTPLAGILVEVEDVDGAGYSAYTNESGYATLHAPHSVCSLIVDYKERVQIDCREPQMRFVTVRLGGR